MKISSRLRTINKKKALTISLAVVINLVVFLLIVGGLVYTVSRPLYKLPEPITLHSETRSQILIIVPAGKNLVYTSDHGISAVYPTTYAKVQKSIEFQATIDRPLPALHIAEIDTNNCGSTLYIVLNFQGWFSYFVGDVNQTQQLFGQWSKGLPNGYAVSSPTCQ